MSLVWRCSSLRIRLILFFKSYRDLNAAKNVYDMHLFLSEMLF